MDIKSFIEYFETIEDPRTGNAKKHILMDIIIIATFAVICGAESWEEMEDFGILHKSWLKNILELPNGIPSHDTFARVFARIKPEAFQNCLVNMTKKLMEETEGGLIAIDGKTLRRSHDRKINQPPLHLVSAWASKNHLTLGQVKTDKKSNEISAINELLDILELKGCTITIDAIGCQKSLAKKIIEQGGHYLFAVKANQGNLYSRLNSLFGESTKYETFDGKSMIFSETNSIDGDHGRIETRHYTALSSMYSCTHQINWPELKTFVRVESQREIGGKIALQSRYYISSLSPNDIEGLSEAIRKHWSIENSLHWSLDVTFNEDLSRIRKGHAPENIAFLRRFALSILKKESSFKAGLRRKQRKAFIQQDYLFKVLQNI